MTTKQLKQELVKALEQLPYEVIADLLEYMKSLQGIDEAAMQMARYLRRILAEDTALLEDLTQ